MDVRDAGSPPIDASVDMAASPDLSMTGEIESAEPDGDFDWRGDLPDDLKRFAANLSTPHDAVRMASGLRQKLSRAVFPPESGATEDEIADFRRRIGVPETPDGYDIRRPDSLAPLLAADPQHNADERAFLEVMHAAGAPPGTVRAATDWYYERLADQAAALARQRDAEVRQSTENLTKEWGAEYERNLDYARRTAQAFGGEALIERFEQVGLGNDPVLFQAFYRIGRELGEDEIFSDSHEDDRRGRLEDRARALRGRRDRWTNTEVDGELRDIMAELHGTQPIHPEGK